MVSGFCQPLMTSLDSAIILSKGLNVTRKCEIPCHSSSMSIWSWEPSNSSNLVGQDVRKCAVVVNSWQNGCDRLPNIDTICGTETDDLSAWLRLDEMVNFAVRDQIFVRWVLWEVREFELLVKSALVGVRYTSLQCNSIEEKRHT